jgi:uncharacterized membrane protein
VPTVLLVLLLAGAAGAQDLSELHCPVLPDELVDPSISVEHDGRRVYFCCQKCRQQFLEDPERYDISSFPPVAEAPRDWRQLAGNLHPLLVHFPIALLLVAALLELLHLWRPAPLLRDTAVVNLVIAALGGVAAGATGWLAGEHASPPGELATVLVWHRWLGLSTVTLCLAAAGLGWRARRGSLVWPYRVVLWLGAVLVSATGYLGGALVHGLDHLAW